MFFSKWKNRYLRRKKKLQRGAGVADNTIQLRTNTENDRYPEIFTTASRLASTHSSDFNVLSFGCSTGEEVLTLAEKYFVAPTRIVGVDIDPYVIKEAQKKNTIPDRVQFFQSNDKVLSDHSPYKVVFAMSVLCAWPDSKDLDDISAHLTFSDFERHLLNLDQHLTAGGYLVIYNASFCFTDSPISNAYDPILVPNHKESGFVKKFDKNNKSLGTDYCYQYAIFQKREVAPPLQS